MIIESRHCEMCNGPLTGRANKIFCSLSCKNEYHLRLRRATSGAAHETDKILHRNRSILLELLGQNRYRKKIHRLLLDQKKFNYHYFTSIYQNTKGKTYYYIYDFGWMDFSDQEIMIVRKKDRGQKAKASQPDGNGAYSKDKKKVHR